MPARLVVHVPDRPAQTIDLDGSTDRTVGRVVGNDIVLDDDRISRRHARLSNDGERWQVADLASKNGTSVDGVPAGDGLPLHDGAWLSFGGLLGCFELLSAEQARQEKERRLVRWQTSIEAQARFDMGDDLERLLVHLLRSILDVSAADRGFVVLAGADGALEPAAAIAADGSPLPAAVFDGSAGAVDRALRSGRPVAHADARASTLLGGRASIEQQGIRSVVCLPIVVLDRRIGAVYADSSRPGHAFTELDVDIMSALAAHAGLAITVVRMHREVRGLGGSVSGRELTAAWDRTLPSYRPTAETYEPTTADRRS